MGWVVLERWLSFRGAFLSCRGWAWLATAGCGIRSTEAVPPDALRCDKQLHDDCFVRVAVPAATVGAQNRDPGLAGYDADATGTELAPATVRLSPYWIMRHEATVGLFTRCADAGACDWAEVDRESPLSNFSGAGVRDQPANMLSWAAAEAACRWLGGKLPSDEQWEVAARGATGSRFPWGEEAGCGVAPVRVKEAERMVGAAARADMMRPPCSASGTVAVSKTVGVSPTGVVGLGGNVWEWTTGAAGEGGSLRVQRGGGWMSPDAGDYRASARLFASPGLRLPDVGFRCVWGQAP